MRKFELVVTTPSASHYLQQLCKHFAHKVPVEHDAQSGRVVFSCGECRMTAEGEVLRISCISPTEEDEQETRAVVGNHLAKFAWREKLELNWQVVGDEV